MADKDIVATIRKRDAERPQKLCDAYAAVMAVQANYSEEAEREAIGAGLDFLVADYRETAELVLQSKQRGGKAMADDRRTVAAALALLAVELRKPAAKAVASLPPAARRPAEKRCGEVKQHEAHRWTEWIDTGEGFSEQRADVWACPGWSEPPRDLSGLKALIADAAAKGAPDPLGIGGPILGEAIKAANEAQRREEVMSLVAGRSGNTVTLDPPVKLDAGMHTFTMPIDPQPGDTIVFDADRSGPVVAARNGDTVVFTTTATINDEGGMTMQAPAEAAQIVAFQFDEPVSVEDTVTVHLDNRGGTFAIDEPPPPGQTVALGGKVLTWGRLREIRETFQRGPETAMEKYGLPVHVSHSQIGTFSECALKGLLTRSETLGVEQLPQWANVGGTAVHLAVERFELMCHSARQVRATVVEQLKAGGGAAGWWASAFGDTVSDVTEANPHAPMETWRASKQGREGYTWWLVEGEGMFQRYVTARMAELEAPWRSPLTMQREGEAIASPMFEHEFVMDVEGVPFKGVIDQAWRIMLPTHNRGDGSGPTVGDIVIDDIKSGSTPSDPAQLREYAAWLGMSGALGRQGGRIWGRFIDVRGGEIASAPFILLHDSNDPAAAGAAWDELAFKVEHTDGIKRSGSFMPRKNNYCVACPVKHACPIMATKGATA